MRFRRRRFFIKKGLQGSFILGFALAVFAGFFLNMVLAYFLIDRELAEGLYRIHLKARTTSEFAGPVLLKLGAVTVPVILAVSAAVGWFLTRRVEVPLLTFRQSVEKLGHGDFSRPLTPDAPDEVAEALGRMRASLAERFRAAVSGVERLEETLAGIERLVGRGEGLSQKREAIEVSAGKLAAEADGAMGVLKK